MKEHDKFTKLLLQKNIKKEKNWNNRFILDKIPQYDAFKDPNYMSLSLMKSKTKLEEKNNSKNSKTNLKKRVHTSHYSINSLTKKAPSQLKPNNNEESFNNKTSNIENKRPKSIYLNRNHLSFMSNITNSTNLDNNQKNPKLFSNYIANQLKTEKNNNNIELNKNINNKDLYSFNDKFNPKTTKNRDINGIKNYIKFKQNSCENLDNNYYNHYSVIKKDKNLLNELNAIKEIWSEIFVTPEYQQSFEEMVNNINDKGEIENLLNNEKRQIMQFKNDFLKLLKVISKREKLIENIKKLDNIFIQNKKLTQYNKLIIEKNKSDSNLEKNSDNLDNDNIEELGEKNNEQIENDIHNCLKLLRINSVNAFHQFQKFRSMNNFIITSNKIDIEKLKNNYEYNKNYLLKMKNDLDFLVSSNVNQIYNFKKGDPFLINLIPEKNKIEKNEKFKTIPVSDELLSTINNSLYILAQEELLFKMKTKKEMKRNKTNNDYDDNKEQKEQKNKIMNINNKNSSNKVNQKINLLKLKSQKEYSKLFFHSNKNSDINLNEKKNGNRLKKIKNLYFNNQFRRNNKNGDIAEIIEIPQTTAVELQKKFDFYNKLKEDLSENRKENTNNKKEKEIIFENKFKYIWFTDTFNKFKELYNEYYNKLTKKTVGSFCLNKNADDFICGVNPKIIIYQKDNNKIYGICGINYYYDGRNDNDKDNENKLILKINHISSLEKDNDESENFLCQKEKIEYKIYKHFIDLIKTLPYQMIELNFYENEELNNKDLLNYFLTELNFEIKDKNKNNNKINHENIENKDNIKVEDLNNSNYKQDEDNKSKKVLIIVNNNNNDANDENIKKLKKTNEIKYNNTSILSIVEKTNDNENNNVNTSKEGEDNNITTKYNMNKYFYKYINTFNLNILINYLTKDNIYELVNSSNEKISPSEDFSKFTSLFIKDQNNNIDNIINITPDCSLIEAKGKVKYAYITSLLSAKIFSYISTSYNKKIYNIFKINVNQINKEQKIYIIPSSDEKVSFYIYQCEEESEIKKEINKSNNDNFNLFDYFSELINDKFKDKNDNGYNEDKYNFEENDKGEEKLLWVPSFNIDTQLICDKLPILKDIIIKNNKDKKFEIKEYTEILKISYGAKELNNNEFIYEPNLNGDIIIENDFIFGITHKDIKNQFNNSIAFLAYITKDNFI